METQYPLLPRHLSVAPARSLEECRSELDAIGSHPSRDTRTLSIAKDLLFYVNQLEAERENREFHHAYPSYLNIQIPHWVQNILDRFRG